MFEGENVIGLLSKQIRKSVSREQGFTLIELMIVILIIGVMLGAVVVAGLASLSNADARGTGEMIKQDLRKVYAMASAGDKPANVDFRYRYRITFTSNSYLVEQGTPSGSGVYGYLPMAPTESETNKTNGNYIQPTSNASTTIDAGSNPTIYFISSGAITVANTDGTVSPGADMQILVKTNGSTVRTITVSGYGNISD